MLHVKLHECGVCVLERWSDTLQGTLQTVLLGGSIVAAALSGPAFAQMTGPALIQSQGSFFVGGQDEQSDGIAPKPILGIIPTSGTWTVNQMYVQFERPYEVSHLPIVLIDGGQLSVKNWETTPDGRMGWYEYFVRQGFPAYVVDHVGRGRSGFDPTPINEVVQGKAGLSQIPTIVGISHESAWTTFRFGPRFPDTFPGLQFPMETIAPNGQFWKQQIPDLTFSQPTPTPTVAALVQLSLGLEGAILVSHSQSGVFPFQAAASDPRGIAGIIAIEPGGCTGTGLDMNTAAKIPTLVLFGDNISKSAFWVPALQDCMTYAAQVKAAGGNIQVVQLPDLGIFGNSHLLMQERNNLAIAQILVEWIQDNIESNGHFHHGGQVGPRSN